jgi:hypothetical protein
MRALLRVDDTEGRRSLRAAAPWLLEEYLKTREVRVQRPERQ